MSAIDEMKAYMEDRDSYLCHYGMPRRSGRYPYGSGENPYQHAADFVGRYSEYKKQGMSEREIAEACGVSTTKLRSMYSLAITEQRMYDVQRAETLKGDGLTNTKIAEIMGLPGESSVRALLNQGAKERMKESLKTAETLRAAVNDKKFIDIGPGLERELGVSATKLQNAQTYLQDEGYEVLPVRVPQVNNPGKWTTVKVLCPPGTTYPDVYKAVQNGEVKTVSDYEALSGVTETNKRSFQYPESMDISRLEIRYAHDKAPDGHEGIERDGLIEIRRGVPDLSLGDKAYAQVRILVDGDRYIKGMAVYSDDLPEGKDVVFNTNKKEGTPVRDVLKAIKSDPDNPFGSLIKEGGQSTYIDKDGKEKLGLINRTREEGDWGDWADKLPSQFLAKQDRSLIKHQLDLSIAERQSEFDQIMNLTNPTVKKQMLLSFSEDCDKTAVYLSAKALPRQKYQVIIPMPELKDNEIYAPNYKNGELVSLIRYPHAGTFEIPQLIVNNDNPRAKKLIGANPLDAVGINSHVAERLSGADFDGDTVQVIPTNSKVRIVSTPALEGLKGFDSKSYKFDKVETDANGVEHYYRNGHEFRIMNNTQNEMGKISNLITDMTIKGASSDELARADRHSMVVIDAEKHKLDYKQSEVDNNIKELKEKYQKDGHTLLSAAKNDQSVDKRVGNPKINKKGTEWYDPDRPEGALIYKTAEDKDLYYTKKTIDKKTGEVKETLVKRTERSTKMAETDDAHTLSTGTPKEKLYADYANELKSLANQARLEYTNTGKIAYSKEAKKKYSAEVESLDDKLARAERNAPRERQAQIIANSVADAKRKENPSMDKSEYKKVKQQALTAARNRVGAAKEKIRVTDSEWEAIQSGAISETKLQKIINNMDSSDLRERATPRTRPAVTDAQASRIRSLANSGHSTAEIAEVMGVSASTVRNYIKD